MELKFQKLGGNMNNKAIYSINIDGSSIGLYYLSLDQVKVFQFLSSYFEIDIEKIDTDEIREI